MFSETQSEFLAVSSTRAWSNLPIPKWGSRPFKGRRGTTETQQGKHEILTLCGRHRGMREVGSAVSCSGLGQPCPCGLPSAAHRPPSGLALHTVSGVAQQVFHVPCISNILGFPLKLRLHPHELWVQPCRASLLCFSKPFQIPPVSWFQRHREHSPNKTLGP